MLILVMDMETRQIFGFIFRYWPECAAMADSAGI
jgi:hypothetical protein